MSFLRRFGTNSAIYTVTNLTQKGAAFLLMPVYTLYLDPAAYGILAIVTAVNGFLSIAFTLGLTGAVTRFYFEYSDEPETLREFWGTVLCTVVILSFVLGGVLLLVGDWLLEPFIGSVAFWPYVAIGVLTTFFQPFFTSFLQVLQARDQAGRYAAVSLANFGLTTALTIALVVFLRWNVTGALLATLLSAAVFFAVAIYLMRKDVVLCLRWHHLRDALVYSLPQVPHSVASQTTAMADRMILNSRLGTAATGVYSVGAMLSLAVEVAAQSVNKAYVPLSMRALKNGNTDELDQVRALGALVVAGFCLLGAGIGAFAPEIVRMLTTPGFSAAATVVPLLVFGSVASAIYYLLVNILFYDRRAIRLLPLGTLTGASLNVTLAWFLIPQFGLMGAAYANLLAQSLTTIAIGALASRFDPVRWEYGRYGIAFLAGLAASVFLSSIAAYGLLLNIAFKLAGLLALTLLLGFVFWQRPLIFWTAAAHMLRRSPGRAAALFAPAKGSR